MEHLIFENKELGLCLHTWQGQKKPERVFLASQIMSQLGYKGGNKTLYNYDLIENVDKVTLTKTINNEFLKQLSNLKLLGCRTSSVIMLYESGVWKLIMQSKKQIGINTRNWLAREVLPSIRQKGYYNLKESELNPLSYLNQFTENKKQIENSKAVNKYIFNNNGKYSEYHDSIHKLVNGLTAKEIKKHFNSKESARVLLRQHLPANAATEALIDEIFLVYKKSIIEISETNIHNSAKETFIALFKLGINPKELNK